jgi:hypothetical protein
MDSKLKKELTENFDFSDVSSSITQELSFSYYMAIEAFKKLKARKLGIQNINNKIRDIVFENVVDAIKNARVEIDSTGKAVVFPWDSDNGVQVDMEIYSPDPEED